MATATQEAPQRQLSNPYAPVVWEEYEAEKARRAEEREKKRSLQRRCLDPEVAAEFEAKKPRYEFKVRCTYERPNEKGRLESKTEEHTIIAQNERDAWAIFCDRIQTWPSPAACEREIKRLSKVN